MSRLLRRLSFLLLLHICYAAAADDSLKFENPRLAKAYTALQAWKSAIFSDPFNFTSNWNGSDVCSYMGVFCTALPSIGRVVAGIDLNHADIAGYLPPELGLLSDLALFHINSNRFCGVVPTSFRRLKLLHELDLSNNRFVGNFPKVVLSLPSLKYLDLRFNEFEGSVPSQLFDKDLDAIFLNDNRFRFGIPQNLGNSPVSVLVLANNNLGGCIPGSIGNMWKTVNEIILLNDNLTGCLPPQIGRLRNLTVFDVSFNQLQGPLPSASIAKMKSLEELDVAHNRFTGVIPVSICQLPALHNFTYSFNYFTGEAPACTATPVSHNGSKNCIPGKLDQRSTRECASPAARPVDCSKLKCGGGGGGGRGGSVTKPRPPRASTPPSQRIPVPKVAPPPPPPTSKSSPSTRSHPPPPISTSTSPPPSSPSPTKSKPPSPPPPPTEKVSPRTHLHVPPPPPTQKVSPSTHLAPPPPSSTHFNYSSPPLVPVPAPAVPPVYHASPPDHHSHIVPPSSPSPSPPSYHSYASPPPPPPPQQSVEIPTPAPPSPQHYYSPHVPPTEAPSYQHSYSSPPPPPSPPPPQYSSHVPTAPPPWHTPEHYSPPKTAASPPPPPTNEHYTNAPPPWHTPEHYSPPKTAASPPPPPPSAPISPTEPSPSHPLPPPIGCITPAPILPPPPSHHHSPPQQWHHPPPPSSSHQQPPPHVAECGLYDFAFTGFEFTWDNRREGEANVKERIDRGFGNLALIQKWGGFLAHHLVTMASDHCPILIENEAPASEGDGSIRRFRRFIFEEMWSKEEECGQIIEQNWRRGSHLNVMDRLALVAKELKGWEKEKFGSVRRAVNELREQIDAIQRQYPSEEVLQQRRDLELNLDKVLEREEVMWCQRSRVNWLKHGDRNTKFFHSFARQRGSINKIRGILGEDNRWRTGQVDVGCVFVQYFRQLFTADSRSLGDEVFGAVEGRISMEHADRLSRPFTRSEIECALKDMGPTKAPGPDGMPPIFYQKYWSTVGDDVVARCLGFLNGQGTIDGLNHTLIALIPKVDDPKKVTEFRPISLCNVLYKLISKTLANRLKQVLSSVISEFQSAFVPGRLIHDNVIAAFETIHNLKRRGKKSRQKVAVKLDMAKAYDRVEWDFLKGMLIKLGFPDRFVSLVMACIQTVTYSVLIQGRPFGRIIPTRGLRQGDPISPYLFLLVAEGFSSLLRKAEREKLLHGVAIARGAPSVSHLFFADDSLLFCDASMPDCLKLKEIFAVYEAASGQKISNEKSAMSFSPRTSNSVKEMCGEVLDMRIVPCHERYLGLPTVTGRSKKKMFKGLADRVWKRVQGWEGKILSKGGKEILIKAVAQSIPTYTMSVFQLPVGVCEDINKHLARFWWGKSGGRGIHWRKWEAMCIPKKEGGMGFRELQNFNKALVAKLGWRLLGEGNSLVGKMLKARYFPRSLFLEAELGSNPSNIWRAIIWGKELLVKGLRWRICNGRSVRVFQDPWVPSIQGFGVTWKTGLDLNMRVAELISEEGGWEVQRLEQIGTCQEVEAILEIPLTRFTGQDRMIWNQNKHGKFSVKSAYWLAMKESRLERNGQQPVPVVSDHWKHLWKLKIPPKMSHFLWRCSTGFMPCMWSLYQRRISNSSLCPRCQLANETPLHVTWECSFSVAVLERARFYSKLEPGMWTDFSSYLDYAIQVLTVDEVKLLVIMMWNNWKERNVIVHGGQPRPAVIIYEQCYSIWNNLLAVQVREQVGRCGTMSNPIVQARWSPPSQGMMKLNCDASVLDNGNQVGIGCVIRGSDGELLLAVGERLQSRLKPCAAELQAVILGLEMMIEHGWRPERVETDCLEAVNLINREEDCLAGEGVLVEKIKFLLGYVGIRSVHHVSRVANGAAHGVAQFVARLNGRHSWFGIGSSWLMDVIGDDRPVTRSSREESGEFSSTDFSHRV